MTHKSIFAASFLIALHLQSVSAAALEQASSMSLNLAENLIAGCEAKARLEGWKMNISIVDAGANLVAFHRMDGAFLGSVIIAQIKAETSAKFPFPTRAIQTLTYGSDDKPPAVPGLREIPGMTSIPGGFPVMAPGGVAIGAIGVSGGTPPEDEACAQAGLAAIQGVAK